MLTYSAQDKTYRVWDMTNYDELYKLPEDDITEIKISPGIMLLILNRKEGHVPLKILSIEDGTVRQKFNHLLHRTKKVEFIEQFNEKLLVKQEGENLQIVDVHTNAIIHVSETKFMTPCVAGRRPCILSPWRLLLPPTPLAPVSSREWSAAAPA